MICLLNVTWARCVPLLLSEATQHKVSLEDTALSLFSYPLAQQTQEEKRLLLAGKEQFIESVKTGLTSLSLKFHDAPIDMDYVYWSRQ